MTKRKKSAAQLNLEKERQFSAQLQEHGTQALIGLAMLNPKEGHRGHKQEALIHLIWSLVPGSASQYELRQCSDED